MKKTLTSLLLVLLIALMTVGSVSAQKNKTNLKGEVISFDGSILIVESNKGEMVEIVIPEGFEIPELVPGDSVLVKAEAGEGGEWIAVSVKLLSHQNTEENRKHTNTDSLMPIASMARKKQTIPWPPRSPNVMALTKKP